MARAPEIGPTFLAGSLTAPRPPGDHAINRYLDAVSAVFTFAMQSTPPLVDKKPKMPKVREIAGRTHTLDEAQEAATCRWLTEKGHPIMATCVHFLIATGLRRGEFEKLTPEQIRHDHVVVYADQTKTNQHRKVFLHPDLAREMRAVVATGQRPRAYRLARTLKSAWRSLGYSAELCVHSLRHTTVTRLIGRGVDISDVQEIVGHSLITTTKRYAHSGDDRKRQAAEKLWGNVGDFTASGTEAPGQSKLKA